MKRLAMLKEVLTISSGTLARLMGSPLYSEIDAGLQAWGAWIMSQSEHKVWSCWQDCWDDYDQHGREKVRCGFSQ